MNKLHFLKLFVYFLLVCLILSSCNTRVFNNLWSGNAEKELFGSSRTQRDSGGVRKAIKRQDKKQRALKKNYAAMVERSRKRTIEIQTLDVQERMKKNEADRLLREKARNKRLRMENKKYGNKYK